ncbi:MAG: GNAT family N-acetyltransferase [Ignavibacteria bacterium]|nr:GNAT family N-acetyltransferase [Ignavibacteria bacterium]
MDSASGQQSKIEIRHAFRPGDAGRLIELHGLLYAQEYGFDHTFEAYVARPLAEFMLSQTPRERIWLVDSDGVLMGCVAIVKHSETEAQLRWFLLHPSLRGRGLGNRLVEEAVAFCRESGYERVFLWTVSSLLAAAQVYHKAGFRLAEEHAQELWGCKVTEQRYDLELRT